MMGLLAGCVAPYEANRTEREAVPKAWAIAPLRAPEATPPAAVPEATPPVAVPEATPPVAVTELPVATPPPDSGAVAPPSLPPPAETRPVIPPAIGLTAPAKRAGPGSVRRHPPLPYPTCPAVALSYCLGHSRPALGEPGEILLPEQVKTLRRCERDIRAGAIARPGADTPSPPELAIVGDRCTREFLKTRSVAAARRRSTR